MKIGVHLLAYNEARILPWTLRHYATFASHITVHDLGSSDGTQAIAKAAGAYVVQHDTNNQCDDMLNKRIKETCWHHDDADWVICADADEFVYFPLGVMRTLEKYNETGTPVVKPSGWEMFSETWPQDDGRQLYDHITHGAQDNEWYAKPVVFSPRRVDKMEFSCGAHSARAWKNGALVADLQKKMATPSVPTVLLLHFHHVRPIGEIAADYDAHRARMSAMNRKMNWGWQGEPGTGIIHAQEKRRMILSGLQKVV